MNSIAKSRVLGTRALLIGAVLIGASPVHAQSEAISPNYSFNIRKKIEPPLLSVVAGSLAFEEANGNAALDAHEQAAVVFQLRNEGFGDGIGLRAEVQLSGATAGVMMERSTALPVVPKGGTTTVWLPLSAARGTADGTLVVRFEITEPNGFGVEPVELEVATVAFAAPRMEVVDYSLTGGGTLSKKQPFDVQVLVQNTGTGPATDVVATLNLPDGVFCLSGEHTVALGVMPSGAAESVVFSCIINQAYSGDQLAFDVELKEGFGTFGSTWRKSVALNSALASTKLVVESRATAPQAVAVASLASDVDRGIPECGRTFENRFAVVIGNEDYASLSPELDPQINVDFAVQDARSMADYFEKALGIPRSNIKLLTNATAGSMRQAVTWLANNARAGGGEAEVFFYYSGHGLPTPSDRIPCLIPVDVAGSTPELGIPLPDLYRQLTAHPIRRGMVVLDACFSGGARNAELVAMKGVRVEPRKDAIPSPLVVLASSSADEASGVYREKQHGYFTYFLLKEIQTQGPTASYASVFEAARASVDRTTARAGSIQRPQVLTAPTLLNDWTQWTLTPQLP